jgi:pimeloyl-ACP methyl ester carboxylesterase
VTTSFHQPVSSPDHAPAVICLHSSAGSARQWSALQDSLADGYRVLVPDLLGYGTGADWKYEQALSLDDEARQIEPLIAAEPGDVHLVGHSFGGAVALRLALRNPGRVRSIALYEPMLANLLHEDSGTRAAAIEFGAMRIAVRRAVYSGRADRAAHVFIDYWSGPGAWRALPEKRRQVIVQRMRKVDAEFDAILCNATGLAMYHRIGVPVLAMVGGATRRPPRQIVDLLCTVLPEVTRREIAGAGHLGPLTHPGDVNPRIRAFLDTHSKRTPLALAA